MPTPRYTSIYSDLRNKEDCPCYSANFSMIRRWWRPAICLAESGKPVLQWWIRCPISIRI